MIASQESMKVSDAVCAKMPSQTKWRTDPFSRDPAGVRWMPSSLSTHKRPLDQVADGVVGQLVELLYLVGDLSRGFETHVTEGGELAAAGTGETEQLAATRLRRLSRFQDAGAVAAGANGPEHVAGAKMGLDLPGKDMVITEVVGDGRQVAGVRRKGQAVERLSVALIATRQFAGDVLGVGRRPAVTTDENGPAGAETLGDERGAFGDLPDSTVVEALHGRQGVVDDLTNCCWSIHKGNRLDFATAADGGIVSGKPSGGHLGQSTLKGWLKEFLFHNIRMLRELRVEVKAAPSNRVAEDFVQSLKPDTWQRPIIQ